jgi:poly(hydroxyalkanoate) granule-associated protein
VEKKFRELLKEDDEKLVDAVLASAQQIWQAGLGAFAVAEQEGGKVFARLVKEGVDMQKRTRRLAEIKVSGVTDTVTKMADNVGRQASGSWDKIEQVFEDRITRTLSSLGVPSNTDIMQLRQRLDELTQTVEELSTKKLAITKRAGRPALKSLEQAQAVTPKRATKLATKLVTKSAKQSAIKSATKLATKSTTKSADKPGTKPAAKRVALAKKAVASRRSPRTARLEPGSLMTKEENPPFVSDSAASVPTMQKALASADKQE